MPFLCAVNFIIWKGSKYLLTFGTKYKKYSEYTLWEYQSISEKGYLSSF